MKENNENQEEDYSNKKENNLVDNINENELFDKTIKYIDENILKGNIFINENDELNEKFVNYFLKLHSEGNDLFKIKNKFESNLSQYYLSCGKIFLSLEIINIYHRIYNKENESEEKFLVWLFNDNKNEQNIFEIGVEIQANSKDIIYFYNQLFNIIENSNKIYFIYRILTKRKENIFLSSVKEEKIFLLLFFYEKFKKYFPSSNPLDIKNKLGLAPLHLSSYYSSREITEILLILGCNVNIEDNRNNIPLHFAIKGGDLGIVKKLILYGGNKYKLNNDKLSPSDYSNKYGNATMKNYFTKNLCLKIESLKDKKYDKLFALVFFGCILLKYKMYSNFWKSYISDIFCFFFFLYFIFRSKDYYKITYPNNNEDTSFEDLFNQCGYDKNKIKNICPKCKIIKKTGTKHCIICDTCVENFDHHCFWINKCINSKILYEFFALLIIILICFVINLVLFLIELKIISKNKETPKNYSFFIDILGLIFYIIVFTFGIAMIVSLLYDRIVEKIYSKKGVTLEENLLNKSHENEGEGEFVINNSNV